MFVLEAPVALDDLRSSRLGGMSRDPFAPSPFRTAFGDRWSRLPPGLVAFHDGPASRSFRGQAEVTRGPSRLAGLIANAFRFPQPGRDIPFAITVSTQENCQLWERRFGTARMTSRLEPMGAGAVVERLGPMAFRLAVEPVPLGLRLTVERGWFLGVPIPRALLPIADATEIEHDGAFYFDVDLTLPMLGRMVQYRGWMKPAETTA